jgi:signal peptidase I
LTAGSPASPGEPQPEREPGAEPPEPDDRLVGGPSPVEEEEAQRRRARLVPHAVTETVWVIGVALLVAVVLRTFVGQAFFIPSESMTPQLEVGDRVVVSKVAYQLHEPRRGDVLVFDCPPGAGCVSVEEEEVPLPSRVVRGAMETVGLRQPSTEEFIKRVVGLPGEVVEGRDGAVWIDSRRLVEPYLADGMVTSDFGPVEVAEGQVWVMGDNRVNSEDSRVFGGVEVGTVVGRSVVRVWPPSRLAFM